MCPSSCTMSKPISDAVPPPTRPPPWAYRILLVLSISCFLSSWDSFIKQVLLVSSFCHVHSEPQPPQELTIWHLSRNPTRGRKTPSSTDLPKQPGHSESTRQGEKCSVQKRQEHVIKSRLGMKSGLINYGDLLSGGRDSTSLLNLQKHDLKWNRNDY